MALIEIGECIYDATLFDKSHGFELLDAVAREAFVNHLHVTGDNAALEASRIIESWVTEMRLRWPGRTFRIYRQNEATEVTIRFHVVRTDLPNWCEQGIEILTVAA